MHLDYPYSLDPLRGLPPQRRLALEILQHPISMQFPPTYVDVLDRIAMSHETEISGYDDSVLRRCHDAILRAEFENELAQ
jgi:hypothetical protein